MKKLHLILSLQALVCVTVVSCEKPDEANTREVQTALEVEQTTLELTAEEQRFTLNYILTGAREGGILEYVLDAGTEWVTSVDLALPSEGEQTSEASFNVLKNETSATRTATLTLIYSWNDGAARVADVVEISQSPAGTINVEFTEATATFNLRCEYANYMVDMVFSAYTENEDGMIEGYNLRTYVCIDINQDGTFKEGTLKQQDGMEVGTIRPDLQTFIIYHQDGQVTAPELATGEMNIKRDGENVNVTMDFVTVDSVSIHAVYNGPLQVDNMPVPDTNIGQDLNLNEANWTTMTVDYIALTDDNTNCSWDLIFRATKEVDGVEYQVRLYFQVITQERGEAAMANARFTGSREPNVPGTFFVSYPQYVSFDYYGSHVTLTADGQPERRAYFTEGELSVNVFKDGTGYVIELQFDLKDGAETPNRIYGDIVSPLTSFSY